MKKNNQFLPIWICALCMCCHFSVAQKKAQKQPLNIGGERQLFIDEYIVEALRGGARYQMHQPQIKEVVFETEAPWEGSYSNYNSIFKDGDIYRMYYRGWHRGAKGELTHDMVWCYAESKDGIHWVKPNLGLFEFNGSKENNIILASKDFGDFKFTFADNMTVFKDHNPDASPDARYKAFVDLRKQKPDWSLLVFHSSDGIHWTPANASTPTLTKDEGSYDSQNTAFWDSLKNEYRAYWRFFDKDSIRAIRTGVSKDFVRWDNQKDIQYTDRLVEPMYTNGIIPYYRAPQIYIGFPARYLDRKWSASMKSLPELKEREGRSITNPRYGTAVTESLLMASHDGITFKRWNEAFLRPGIERNGTWNYGHQYIAWSFLETKSDLEGAPDEISLYANEGLWTGESSALRRYTLRLDGFVSINAPMSGGRLLTKAFLFKGRELSLNFSTSALGSIRVEIQDAKGKALPGFSLDECSPVFGDTIDRTVSWNKGNDLSELEGKELRLLYEIK
ncbi:MAG: hypothetical protein JNL51_17380, partial [Chitinophagaceae bacterium]|nr:hypothetical protein [Chitinophagaceae bacterium]